MLVVYDHTQTHHSAHQERDQPIKAYHTRRSSWKPGREQGEDIASVSQRRGKGCHCRTSVDWQKHGAAYPRPVSPWRFRPCPFGRSTPRSATPTHRGGRNTFNRHRLHQATRWVWKLDNGPFKEAARQRRQSPQRHHLRLPVATPGSSGNSVGKSHFLRE